MILAGTFSKNAIIKIDNAKRAKFGQFYYIEESREWYLGNHDGTLSRITKYPRIKDDLGSKKNKNKRVSNISTFDTKFGYKILFDNESNST